MRSISLVTMMIWTSAQMLLPAQLDLLTPGEASRIVMQIPRVKEAVEQLKCPMLTEASIADPRDPIRVDVAVRASCSSFHDRYVVDRRTGTVTTWGDNPSAVGSRTSEVFARQLVTEAKARLLSMQESRCLALTAARSLPGWSEPGGSITFSSWTAPGSPATLFQLRHHSPKPRAETAVLLFVDPTTGHVRNEGSGEEIASSGLGALLAKVIALKYTPLLTDRDALSIALEVPALVAALRNRNCSVTVSSALTPEQTSIIPACKGRYVDGAGVLVDLRNGVVSDAETGKAIDSPEVLGLARRHVAALLSARTRLRVQIDSDCAEAEGGAKALSRR